MEEGMWRIILKQIAHNLAESERHHAFILDLTESEKMKSDIKSDMPFSFL